MSTIVQVSINNLDEERLVEFGIKLGQATGWAEFWFVDEEVDGEEDRLDDEQSSKDYTIIAVAFRAGEDARAFASRFTPIQEDS